MRIFEYSETSDIIGKNVSGLFVSDRVKEFGDAKCIVESGTGLIKEAVVRYKDGTTCPIEVSFSEAKDKQGHILGKMASFVDISKRKQAENKLHKSQEKLRLLSRKIIESQENERKLVAKELHDSVGGNLAAIKLALEQKLVFTDGGHSILWGFWIGVMELSKLYSLKQFRSKNFAQILPKFLKRGVIMSKNGEISGRGDCLYWFELI